MASHEILIDSDKTQHSHQDHEPWSSWSVWSRSPVMKRACLSFMKHGNCLATQILFPERLLTSSCATSKWGHQGACPHRTIYYDGFLSLKRICASIRKRQECYKRVCNYGHDYSKIRLALSEAARNPGEIRLLAHEARKLALQQAQAD